jgi:peptidoglycan hydrolase CwlO-like protein
VQDKIEKIQQKVKDLDTKIATATKNKGDCQAKIEALEAELAEVRELLKVRSSGLGLA